MPIVKVDRSTFTALCLAQGAISYARHALPYGSANQYQDMHGNREGGKSGAQSLPRLKACRTGAAIRCYRQAGQRDAQDGALVAAAN